MKEIDSETVSLLQEISYRLSRLNLAFELFSDLFEESADYNNVGWTSVIQLIRDDINSIYRKYYDYGTSHGFIE